MLKSKLNSSFQKRSLYPRDLFSIIDEPPYNITVKYLFIILPKDYNSHFLL